MNFEDLGLCEPLLRSVKTQGYTAATPIQEAAIPAALKGQDILGCAQTGTGKTASFALPILQRLSRERSKNVRALILAPTRELAEQICENIEEYGQFLQLRVGMIIGGVSMRPQEDMLRRGVDILVATPGRLMDHLNRRTVSLDYVEIAVLDEADRMLDMGFIRDIRRIFTYMPDQRQTMLFSATLPNEIVSLAKNILFEPVRVEVAKRSTTPKSVRQIAVSCRAEGKRQVLLQLLAAEEVFQAIVFTRTKWGANKLTTHLERHGHNVAAIHGNKSQAQRRAALQGFRDGNVRVLVATDIAARGLDVDGVTHVINYELPNAPEDYVHRIGRTGRASSTGVAISLVSEGEQSMVRSIERLTGTLLAKSVMDTTAFVDAAQRLAQEPQRARCLA